MRKSNLFAALALAVGIGGTVAIVPSAIADDNDGHRARVSTRADYLSIGEIHQRLASAGYTRIDEIELDDGKYEVEAVDRNGREVELDLDPRTGRILKVEYDD